ncbi:Phosphatidylserine decarboxylase proenzyme [Usitatibacter palustris]|uniref:Phosphatidylserine decarboxylase proenzyme n=2 Tax=Usitatibacter palustris TaxID=2732487 RepID=A0A6M4H2M0_9PROT|nr:Phosphatidylserine decarboxylase proenzyme [Usitatibacter palustris]
MAVALLAALCLAAFLFWRHYWFFRDPQRTPPAEIGLVSPADGTVVYVKDVAPGADVVSIKQGLSATVKDITREDSSQRKIVIGIFMSPFDVHYNRAPLSGKVAFVRRHPAIGSNVSMTAMHWRSMLGIEPRYSGSTHIVQNERAVTRIEAEYRGGELPLYVVQIGALTVNGIDSYFAPGTNVERGATFGMIRVGSQVDLVVPWREGFEVRVKPGDRVTAGESILLR